MAKKRSEARARPQREAQPERELDIDVPNDSVNEQVVLAAMLVDEETCDRLLPMLPADAFYAEEHRILREAIATTRRKKLTLDPAVIARVYPDVDQIMIERLRETRPEVAPNIDFHVDTLLWDAHRARVTLGPISSLITAIQNPREERDRVIALARSVADAFSETHGRSRFLLDPKEVVRQTMLEVNKRVDGEAFYPYGIHSLDYYEDGSRRIRPGACPAGITLVTALSGSGKSTLMAHLALGLGKQRRKVLFGAWEEEAPITLELLATLNLGWSRSRVLDGKSNTVRTEGDDDWAPMTKADLIAFEEECHKIAPWVRFCANPFDHSDNNATNEHHLDIIRSHIEDSGCEVFFADLLHRCFVDDNPSAERRMLFGMLKIAQDTRTHHIWAHQQRAKDIETRVNKTPTREGIIGAGAWLDVPWVVMAPHLPAKWKEVEDNTMELYILKQRKGPWPIAIEFEWNPDTGQIANGRSVKVKHTVDSSDPAFSKPKGKKPGRAERAFRSRSR
jgi:hypothetical protein